MPEGEEWPPNEEERKLLFKSISQASSHLIGRAWDYVWKFTGIHRSNSAGGGWNASVQGTRLYSVTVALDGNNLCTCPYFSEHLDCKHLIALRLRLFEEGDALELPDSDVEPPPALTPQVESGLQILRKIAATLNTSQEDASSRIREVAFVLMLTDTRRRIRSAEIVPRPRVFTKRDGWSLDRADLRHTILHTQFPPKYISPNDMRLIEACGDPPADYGLTGTPIENALSDLWSQFTFLNPGLLGPREEFLSQFSPEPGETPDLSRLRLVTAPFWMRRTKAALRQRPRARAGFVASRMEDLNQSFW